jgi:pimeloyl-ACP methyl ester carboxylesterase
MTAAVHAQTPAPAPDAGAIRQIPPPGIAVPDADRAELTVGVEALGKEIESLRTDLKNKRDLLRYLPDVQIYHKAVSYVLNYNEFFNPKEIATAKTLLEQGQERVKALRAGSAPWTKQTGLVALGYVSHIDGSVQPYGLVVPKEWGTDAATPRRLDIFCHGRGDTLTELAFIDQRQRSPGEFTPEGAFVLHPYGRFCNATRFAGEMDVIEALDDVAKRYPIDQDRLVMRGFSMGGASAWQFATHYADHWAAASPGAGFTHAASYTSAFAPGKIPPPWYEQKMWNLYDPVAYAVNLAQCPTVAYSGEIDKQKQAADNMAAAMQKEGLTLTHIIGPQTGHKYHPDSKKEINRLIDGYAAKGRDFRPARIRFTTFTLRYNQMNWLTVEGLERHWERARVDADLTDPVARKVTAKTENVTRLWFNQKILRGDVRATIDGQDAGTGRLFVKTAGVWRAVKGQPGGGLRKAPGLQGPIDDAFMGRFVMVRPTGKPQSEAVGAWARSEMDHAARQWRTMFRGEAPMKDDVAVTAEDIRNANLVLWGDPASNSILAKIADKLPIRWAKDGSVKVGAKTYPAGTSVPVLIYPNPLNPARYVVVNSGLTWREAHGLTNAQQTPKLPDWAIIDITTPPDKRVPGRVVDADFFDESWRLRPPSPHTAATLTR